ncbi:SHOCT domain-containing protein [Streptomyces sp. NPDC005408]|uniref:SHOCT domain-containing protein n=1 Tax=Streptomyces sp. NPDC005408 TaxID=3155341 RepID=UPI0033A1E58E
MLGRPMRRAGRPGVVGVAARSAVVAGTATAVSGRVARHQAEKAAAAQQTASEPDVQPAPQAQAPPSAPPSAGLTEEAISNLERLGKLREQGVLSDEEFAVQKDRILRG